MSPPSSRSALPILAALAGALACAPAAAPAQEETAAEGSRSSCTLRWESLTDSTGSRSIQLGPDRYRHHVWNGMRWTCADAVMTADSAVQFPGERVEMVGSVSYGDSVRTLDARALTYHQSTDLIEARDSVRLVRRATGSTLEAPAVDFYRAGSGEIRRTVATGGARMTVVPAAEAAEGAQPEPYHVSSDTAIILEDEVTVARGNVIVTRQEFRGTGASGRFDPRGTGLLTGDPVLEGEEYRLTGDTVRTLSADGELREVRATGSGHLESGEMDVRGPEIRVALADGDVRDLWSYGGGVRSRSASRVMLGDSLHIVFGDEQPDSAVAVGRAAALELEEGEPMPPLQAPAAGRDPAGGAPPDTAAAAAQDTVAARPDTMAAVDTAAGVPGDTVAAAPADTAAPPSDTAAATLDTAAAAPAAADLFTVDRDWIRGDTVRARFGRAPPDSAAGASAAAGDTAGPRGEVTLRRLLALGNARAYYRVSRDTARDRRGRNYLLGREVVVEFREGEPYRVLGVQAIGVYLEPTGPGAASVPGPPASPDSVAPGAGARPDSTLPPPVAPPDTVPPDTTASRRPGGGGA